MILMYSLTVYLDREKQKQSYAFILEQMLGIITNEANKLVEVFRKQLPKA